LEQITAGRVRNFAATSAVLFGLYLAAYAIVWAVITPTQDMFVPGLGRFASLLFLPHGVRVLSASLLGARSVPAMVLGELAGNYLVAGVTDPTVLVMSSLIAGTVTWLVLEGLRALDLNAFYTHVTDEPPPFHTLLLAAIIASAANAFFLTSLLEDHSLTGGHVTTLIAAYLTGDVTGFLAIVAIAHYVMPDKGN
jgi:hypothetical protein